MVDLLSQYDIRQASNLELLAKQVVEGFIIGLHKSPFHGFSVEFAEHRLYNPGEHAKSVDWKVFARTDKMFTKRYEEETNLRCRIIVDVSSSMFFPKPEKANQPVVNKLAFSILASAALMNLLKKQRDAYGISLFSDSVEQHTGMKSSTMHYDMCINYLLDVLNNPRDNKQTSTAKCLHEIAEGTHRRSLVVIFSDMFDGGNSDELFSALQHLRHNKHEVVLFHVVDKRLEVDFAFDNKPYLFIDMETGEKVKLQPNQIKEHYVAQVKEFKDELKMRCLQLKIDFVEADINEGFNQILMPYLMKRNMMR